MKLWLISQTVNDGYDTYSSAVVAAETTEVARHLHPRDPNNIGAWWINDDCLDTWAHPKDVTATYIGEARPDTVRGVICASFHAG